MDGQSVESTITRANASTDVANDERIPLSTLNPNQTIRPLGYSTSSTSAQTHTEGSESSLLQHQRQISLPNEAKQKIANELNSWSSRIALADADTGTERDTTGTPFVRAPSLGGKARYLTQDAALQQDKETVGNNNERTAKSLSSQGSKSSRTDQVDGSHNKALSGQRKFSILYEERRARVPVGLSRLHLVEMPELQVNLPPSNPRSYYVDQVR